MLDTKLSTTSAHLVTALIEAMPEPVLVVTGDSRVVAVNRHARAILPALRIGGNLALALRDPDILDGIGRVFASGRSEQVAWRERVPVERVFDVTVAPLDQPSTDRALVLTLRDLTESLRVERMRADFIANASHELRTPLASLLGFVETLQGPARDDARARARFLSIMGDQARRMARLVDDLLSLSRIEQHLHLRPDQPVDLALAVRHVADTLAPLAEENGVRLLLRASEPVVVAGDRDELLRVAENLVENAIKYGGPQQSGPPADGVLRAGPEGRTRRCAPYRDRGVVAPRQRCVLGPGPWSRDRGRAPASADGTVLPHRRRAEPCPGRDRSGTRDRQAYRGPSSRPTSGRKRGRPGSPVYRHDSSQAKTCSKFTILGCDIYVIQLS